MIKPVRLSAVRLLTPLAALVIAGCGSSSSSSSSPASSAGQSSSSAAAAASATSSAGPSPAVADELAAAQHPSGGQFPPTRGRSLQQLAALVKSSAQFGAATGTFTPGMRRLAFAVNAGSGQFIYAPSAIYIARTPSVPARGPFLAPADSLIVAPQYRSKQNVGPGDIKAVYAAALPIPRAGTYTVLSITRTPDGLIGAPGKIAVAASSPIPDVGQRLPDIATDSAATVHGDTALLTTRIPPEPMHSVSLRQVLGRRPIALLFSTPQLCMSRVCGPVTDVAVSLQRKFGSRITFIHQEVYVDNQPSKGLRPQLKAFHLQTEPWLFTINRHGVITARLEGAFGSTELAQALRSALR